MEPAETLKGRCAYLLSPSDKSERARDGQKWEEIFCWQLPITRGDRGDELPHSRPWKESYGSRSTSDHCPSSLLTDPLRHLVVHNYRNGLEWNAREHHTIANSMTKHFK